MPRRLRFPLVWLVLCLLVVQTLGLVHSVVHAVGPGGALVEQAAGQNAPAGGSQRSGPTPALMHDHVHGHGPRPADAGRPPSAHLFAGHASDADCRLFDQLCSGTALNGVPSLVLPLALSSFILRLGTGEVLVRWTTQFDARGPPVRA